MDSIARDLAIAIAGAIIGSLLIFVFSFGFRWTKQSRESRRRERESERKDWLSNDPSKRQRITNAYLFSVLKFFVMGSILIGVSSAISDLVPNDCKSGLESTDYIMEGFDIAAVISYLATFSKIWQYMRLLRQHP
jgi:hypothetical protein